MNLFCETTPRPSILVEGRNHSDTCIYRPTEYIPRSVNTAGIPSTYSIQSNPSKKTYSMGWLAKLIKPKPEETKFLPISHESKTSIIKERVHTENGSPHVLQHIPSPTTPEDNVYYKMKLKIHKLSDYATSWQALSKSPSNISVVNETKKRKTDDFKQDFDKGLLTKRRRESVDDNNNLRPHIDDNDDDELDAEVAMYMENSGPPTIRADIPGRGSNMGPAYTGYQPESPLPWLRYIEGCYHSYRSPIELTKSPPNIPIVKETKKRKAGDLEPDIHTKRRRNNNPRPHIDDINNLRTHTDSNNNLRHCVDDNNNLRHCVDDNNNLDDDELDAEVAMYMENSGPPTIRAHIPDRGSYTGYKTESPLPWLRCIEGCYHSYKSPLGITREPREGAIKILDPWPCLYRNTKFGELKKVGGLNEERAPRHWRIGDENN